MIEHIMGNGVLPTPLPFSQATRAGGFVFVSGQASVDESGAIVPDTFDNEARRTLQNLQRVLRAAGCELRDVVQLRAYLREAEKFARFNEIYREFFEAPFPARTTLTGCLPDIIQIEIDCIARVPETAAPGEGDSAA